jgi:hypothetical protein
VVNTLGGLIEPLKAEVLTPVLARGEPGPAELEAVDVLADRIAAKHREVSFRQRDSVALPTSWMAAQRITDTMIRAVIADRLLGHRKNKHDRSGDAGGSATKRCPLLGQGPLGSHEVSLIL